jgi:hypothetical protein
MNGFAWAFLNCSQTFLNHSPGFRKSFRNHVEGRWQFTRQIKRKFAEENESPQFVSQRIPCFAPGFQGHSQGRMQKILGFLSPPVVFLKRSDLLLCWSEQIAVYLVRFQTRRAASIVANLTPCHSRRDCKKEAFGQSEKTF